MIKKILYIWIVALCANIGACLQVAAAQTDTEKAAIEARKGEHLPIRSGFYDQKKANQLFNDLEKKGIFVMWKENTEAAGAGLKQFDIILPKKEVNKRLKEVSEIKKASKNAPKLSDLSIDGFIELINLFLEKTPYECNHVLSDVFEIDFTENKALISNSKYKKVSFKKYLKFVTGESKPSYGIFLYKKDEEKTKDQQKFSFSISLTPNQKKGGYLIGGLALIVIVYLWLGSSKEEANQGKTKKSSKGSKQK